eukprot:scaffold20104_cov120-Isochrysis_galbana.AAC.10
MPGGRRRWRIKSRLARSELERVRHAGGGGGACDRSKHASHGTVRLERMRVPDGPHARTTGIYPMELIRQVPRRGSERPPPSLLQPGVHWVGAWLPPVAAGSDACIKELVAGCS